MVVIYSRLKDSDQVYLFCVCEEMDDFWRWDRDGVSAYLVDQSTVFNM
jgi:hypothetical protein